MIDIFDALYIPVILKRKLFSSGWGQAACLDEIEMPKSLPLDKIKRPNIIWESKDRNLEYTIEKGHFPTIVENPLIPEETRNCHIELITPNQTEKTNTPIVVHFGASGDPCFKRRRKNLALPLLKEGIGSLLIQSPFYGTRKPPYQKGTELKTVKDLLLLGMMSIEEGRSLCVWLKENNYGPLAVTGISRGGLTASIVAAVTPLPLGVASCIACHSGAPVFTQGIIRHSINWKILFADLQSSTEINRKINPRDYMRQMLNMTDISRFPLPKHPDAAIFVSAKNDGIIPIESAIALGNHWPGSELRWINGGHVSSFVFHQNTFRQAIIDALKRISILENQSLNSSIRSSLVNP